MTSYALVRATQAHVDQLVADMRDEDAAECAAFGLTPAQALSRCLASRNTLAGVADDKTVAIFGLRTGDYHPRLSLIWLLSSREANAHKIAFARWSKAFVDDKKHTHKWMGNFVDARYEKSVKWLKWLGFEIRPAIPLAPHGFMFHWFEMRS